MEKLLLTQKEAANALSISVETLYGMYLAGEIRRVQIGARVYYSVDELKSFVAKEERYVK